MKYYLVIVQNGVENVYGSYTTYTGAMLALGGILADIESGGSVKITHAGLTVLGPIFVGEGE